ncbi:MAG: hypothetical protein RDU20_00665 [Desulfomonilaceae bacterium]|nr:hypothetical protein [Desulfomonilaceae bacterium]
MNTMTDHESRLKELMRCWNNRIDRLRFDAEQGGPEVKKKNSEEISVLVLNREAARRGLLTLADVEPCFAEQNAGA